MNIHKLNYFKTHIKGQIKNLIYMNIESYTVTKD